MRVFGRDDLERLMEQVDAKLAEGRVPLQVRPFEAMSEVSRELGDIELPIVGTRSRGKEHPTDWISRGIWDWYKMRYGDRLKLDAPLGRVAIRLRGDLWVLRIPVAYGEVQVVASREHIPKPPGTRGPALCNVVDCVQGLPEGLRSALSDEELKEVVEFFLLGYHAFRDLPRLGEDGLVHAALLDHKAAVNHLIGRPQDSGQSKWASLQATEKTMKAFTAATGRQFSKGHNLDVIAKEAESAGLPRVDRALLFTIQCGAEVRYGEVSVTQDEALSAHRAALEVARHVSSAIAKKSP